MATKTHSILKERQETKKTQWLEEAKINGAHKSIVDLTVYVYSDTKQIWIATKRQFRNFDTIILPAEEKDLLIRDVMKFERGSSFYHEHNIPYRRGYFLYGPPGTGKTSIAFAIATLPGRPIYFMPASLSIDAITTIPHGSLILFEDADKMIVTKETEFRKVEPEPVPITTTYPTINPDEHYIWLKAIRNNETVQEDYRNNYKGLDSSFDAALNNGVSLLDSVIEGILTDMKNGFPEPKKAKSSKREGVDFSIEYEPAETDEEYHERRTMYKNIIKEANRLRQEHYDSVRFDQERICLLLQIIDGALTPYNSIFVMTTNRRNDIHSALIRAGRMDVVKEITYLSDGSIHQMFDRFNIPADKREEMIKKVRIPGRAHNITAADLQGVIIDNHI